MSLTKAQLAEIEHLRSESTGTLRPTSPGLEAILHSAIPVLDHGFIRVVDYMGNDDSVVQAARVSYGKGTKKASEDAALISYLMRHAHTTPFEMAEIKLHVKLPIFVARQWIRHRTASVNEYSARYSILDREFYIPHRSNLAAQSTSNKQGRSDVLDDAEASEVLEMLREDANRAYDHYQALLNVDEEGNELSEAKVGLARELARMNLSLNYYTQWYWKVDLHNYMGFLKLRADPHAQYEIRAYAEVMLEILKNWVPRTYDAFMQYRLGCASLSAAALDVVRAWISGTDVGFEQSGLSRREWSELDSLLRREKHAK